MNDAARPSDLPPLDIAVVGGGPGGLYFAILMKKADPRHRITVFERNRPDDTFGFGVVFSDETLGNFEAADPPSYDSITDAFAYWGAIDVNVRGQRIRSDGHGFCGLERKTLLGILHERAASLGVVLNFESEVTSPDAVADYDLVIAADGINSLFRERYQEHFRPRFDWRHNKFCWLGSTRSLPAFTFTFKENEHGIWILGAYQFNAGMSTWVPECTEETWRRAGLDRATEAESDEYWATRPRGSQAASWSSRQSQALETRATLESRYLEVEREYDGRPIPRPPFWGGYRLTPERIEFWKGATYRLHDRVVYTRQGDHWVGERQYP